MVAGFAAGAFTVAAALALSGVIPEPGATRVGPDPGAGSARVAALVREHAPHELPPEWRWRIRGVDVDGMFRKQR